MKPLSFFITAIQATATFTLFLNVIPWTAQAVDANSAPLFSGRYKSACPEGISGCACRKQPDFEAAVETRIRHATPVTAAHSQLPPAGLDGWVELRLPQTPSCFYPARDLRPIYWDNLLCPSPDAEAAVPFPRLDEILAEGSVLAERRALGSYFPTFYNIADEGFHEGALTETLLESGSLKPIAKVTAGFRKELDIQGTGRLKDGRILNVADRIDGVWRYRILSSGEYGHGILGHRIHPMRSVAVDFAYLCESAGSQNCKEPIETLRRKWVGALLYIPRLEGARLAPGAIHDGYVCAQDIGGAIREDRMDIFVGPAGAGNPYLPECRTRNALIDHGIESINPTDWPSVEATGVDAEGRTTYKRKFPFEYRTASPQKGLSVFLVPGAKCKP